MLLCAWQLLAQDGAPYGNNPKAGNTINVNGVDIYYEIYGDGPVLLLLHGNGGSIKGRANILPKLSEKYRVVTMDSRCHGRSGCPETDLNYEDMAKDANALLEHLKIGNAFIYGHSDGGITGLIMAYSYPDKVRRLLVSGANIRPDGSALEPELVEMMKMYPQIPDAMMRKHIKLMVEHPNINPESLRNIQAPVMIMSGDRDAVRLEHSVEIFRAIPNANLCVLPATSHYIGDEKGNLLVYWMNEFFFKDFTMPSTVESAKKMAAQLFGNGK